MSADQEATLSRIEELLAQIPEGNPKSPPVMEAHWRLLEAVYDRLLAQIQVTLRRFPTLERAMEPGQILNQKRLLSRFQNALTSEQPWTTRHLFGLAGKNIRWHLLDLVQEMGRRRRDRSLDALREEKNFEPEAPRRDEGETLEAWEGFLRAVEDLPEDDRTLIDLLFHQGLTQQEAAPIMGLRSDRAIRYRLDRIKQRLGQSRGRWLEVLNEE